MNPVGEAGLLADYTHGHNTDIFFIAEAWLLDRDDPECKELTPRLPDHDLFSPIIYRACLHSYSSISPSHTSCQGAELIIHIIPLTFFTDRPTKERQEQAERLGEMNTYLWSVCSLLNLICFQMSSATMDYFKKHLMLIERITGAHQYLFYRLKSTKFSIATPGKDN